MKYLTQEGLEYYTKNLKQYIDMKVELQINKSTHCTNCGTNFEQSMLWKNRYE